MVLTPLEPLADQPATGGDMKAQRVHLIKQALDNMNRDDPGHFPDGVPNHVAVSEFVEFETTADEVMEVWTAMEEIRAEMEASQPPNPPDPPAPDQAPNDAPRPSVPPATSDLQAALADEALRLNPNHIAEGMAAPRNWSVIDTNAQRSPRVHDLGGGRVHQFSPGKATQMPQADAVCFLSSTSFRVFNADGQRVTSMPEAEKFAAGKDPAVHLAPDDIVVKFSELTLEALLIRVQRMPGGEGFTEQSSREAMEAFLMDARAKLAKGGTPPPGTADLDQGGTTLID